MCFVKLSSFRPGAKNQMSEYYQKSVSEMGRRDVLTEVQNPENMSEGDRSSD
jgi:hypothetical protein